MLIQMYWSNSGHERVFFCLQAYWHYILFQGKFLNIREENVTFFYYPKLALEINRYMMTRSTIFYTENCLTINRSIQQKKESLLIE